MARSLPLLLLRLHIQIYRKTDIFAIVVVVALQVRNMRYIIDFVLRAICGYRILSFQFVVVATVVYRVKVIFAHVNFVILRLRTLIFVFMTTSPLPTKGCPNDKYFISISGSLIMLKC